MCSTRPSTCDADRARILAECFFFFSTRADVAESRIIEWLATVASPHGCFFSLFLLGSAQVSKLQWHHLSFLIFMWGNVPIRISARLQIGRVVTLPTQKLPTNKCRAEKKKTALYCTLSAHSCVRADL